MFISKFSKLGGLAIKGLSKAAAPLECRPRTRTSYFHVARNHYPLRHEPFSTTAADDGQAEGNVEKQNKISVTFVDKDGEEQNIKVPVGMSMLEAAHENDIELEGNNNLALGCC